VPNAVGLNLHPVVFTETPNKEGYTGTYMYLKLGRASDGWGLGTEGKREGGKMNWG